MQTGANQLKKSLLLFFACIMICWAETGFAFEPLRGKVTANLNLRTSPRRNGKIIAGLKKGEIITITDQHEKWYQVFIERGTYGYKGWTYGKYIKKIDSEKEGAVLPLEEKMQKKSIKKALPESSLGGKDEKTEPLAVSQKNAFSQDSLPGFNKELSRQFLEKNPSDREDEKSERLRVSREKAKGQLPVLNDRGDFNKGQVVGAFIRLLLKLSSLVLSCLALLFSYKALQIAKVSRDAAKRLQQE